MPVHPEYPIRRQNEGRFSLFHYLNTIVKMKILKQVLGIDVAQKELVVSVGRLHEDLTTEIYANKVFANTSKGFDELISWVKKLTVPHITVRFVMEATGVYHESLAYF